MLPCLLRLLDGVDPGLCRFLAGGARVCWNLVDKIVELEVGLAAGARDEVPFGRLDRIDRRADGR